MTLEGERHISVKIMIESCGVKAGWEKLASAGLDNSKFTNSDQVIDIEAS